MIFNDDQIISVSILLFCNHFYVLLQFHELVLFNFQFLSRLHIIQWAATEQLLMKQQFLSQTPYYTASFRRSLTVSTIGLQSTLNVTSGKLRYSRRPLAIREYVVKALRRHGSSVNHVNHERIKNLWIGMIHFT